MIYIILGTLVVYSIISTLVFILSGQKEDVLLFFGLGIVGIIIWVIQRFLCKIRDLFKYRIGKYAIFEEVSTGKKYKCNPKDTNDVIWAIGYKLVKRYAVKAEWRDIPDLDKAFIESCRRNCDNCKYGKECQCDYPYNKIKCSHNEYGEVLEFDKFEKF